MNTLVRTILRRHTVRIGLTLSLLSGALCNSCISAAQDTFSIGDELTAVLSKPSLEYQNSWTDDEFSGFGQETDERLFKTLFNEKVETSVGFLDNIQERYLTIRTGKREKITAVYQNGAYGFAFVENW